ncbi:MAG TPA: hypothetical protein VFN11_14330 [Ktedonobacterales bacterium]|nr:hypothetical protein [Ktedonobacterales bacterium]
MAEEIVMTPENKPLLDALIRLVALGRDPDAEDMLVEAIQELVAKRAEVAAMRPIVKAVSGAIPDDGRHLLIFPQTAGELLRDTNLSAMQELVAAALAYATAHPENKPS